MEFNNLMQHLEKTPIRSDVVRRLTDRDTALSMVKWFLMIGRPTSTPDELRPFATRSNELSLYDGCILRGSRIVPPEDLRPQLLRELHDAHSVVHRMKALTRGYCWRLNIDQDIERLVKNCEQCQKCRRQKSPGPISPWRCPERPWRRVHADYLGPNDELTCILLIDAHSKLIEVQPVPDASSAASCKSALHIRHFRYPRGGMHRQRNSIYQ
ncbi:unnamed protein product [Dicrocoelium dendriticum]|nr:unnamed protein product [Dicrocoelium dendriticum]